MSNRTSELPNDQPAHAGKRSVSILRSLSALAKQPLTREDSPKIHQSVRASARQAKVRPESFRRIALRRPESAATNSPLRALRERCPDLTADGEPEEWLPGMMCRGGAGAAGAVAIRPPRAG